MPAIDYVALASKVQRVVEDNGKSVTLVKKSKGTLLDANKPWRANDPATPGETTEAVTAVEDEYDLAEIDGANIRIGDKKFLVAANSVSSAERTRLSEYELIRDGGETWRIKKLGPVEPGSVPILFTFHVEKLGREDVNP